MMAWHSGVRRGEEDVEGGAGLPQRHRRRGAAEVGPAVLQVQLLQRWAAGHQRRQVLQAEGGGLQAQADQGGAVQHQVPQLRAAVELEDAEVGQPHHQALQLLCDTREGTGTGGRRAMVSGQQNGPLEPARQLVHLRMPSTIRSPLVRQHPHHHHRTHSLDRPSLSSSSPSSTVGSAT